MSHVQNKLESWLADELSAGEVAKVESHLASCSDCRGRAEELRQVWAMLGGQEESTRPRESIWSGVRLQTIGLSEKNDAPVWFGGQGRTLRAAVAATAVAAGLTLAFIIPVGQQIEKTTSYATGVDGDSDMEWLSGSTIFSPTNHGFLDEVWFGSDLENEGEGS